MTSTVLGVSAARASSGPPSITSTIPSWCSPACGSEARGRRRRSTTPTRTSGPRRSSTSPGSGPACAGRWRGSSTPSSRPLANRLAAIVAATPAIAERFSGCRCEVVTVNNFPERGEFERVLRPAAATLAGRLLRRRHHPDPRPRRRGRRRRADGRDAGPGGTSSTHRSSRIASGSRPAGPRSNASAGSVAARWPRSSRGRWPGSSSSRRPRTTSAPSPRSCSSTCRPACPSSPRTSRCGATSSRVPGAGSASIRPAPRAVADAIRWMTRHPDKHAPWARTGAARRRRRLQLGARGGQAHRPLRDAPPVTASGWRGLRGGGAHEGLAWPIHVSPASAVIPDIARGALHELRIPRVRCVSAPALVRRIPGADATYARDPQLMERSCGATPLITALAGETWMGHASPSVPHPPPRSPRRLRRSPEELLVEGGELARLVLPVVDGGDWGTAPVLPHGTGLARDAR